MKKNIIAIAFFNVVLLAGQCPDEFSPSHFIESPSYFEDLVDVSSLGKTDKNLGFIKKGDTFYKPNSFIIYKDYIYPKINGFWSYKKDKNGKIYEVNVAQIESETMDTMALAEMVNNDFEDIWQKTDGDGYEHYMYPEFTRFEYGKSYLSLKVFFWGVSGDSAHVNKSTINYQIIDFTDEVNGFIHCDAKSK